MYYTLHSIKIAWITIRNGVSLRKVQISAFQKYKKMHQAGQKSYFPLIADQCISCGKSGIPIPGKSNIVFYEDKTRDPATPLTLDLFLNPTISSHFSTILRPLTPFPLDNKHPTYLANVTLKIPRKTVMRTKGGRKGITYVRYGSRTMATDVFCRVILPVSAK